MFTSHLSVFRGLVIAAGAFLVMCTATPAKAAEVYIDDLTDTVSVSGANGAIISNVHLTGEGLSFTFTSSVPAEVSESVYADLLEPGTTNVSDRLTVTSTKDSVNFDALFASDPNAISVGSARLEKSVTEDGSYQSLIRYFYTTNNNTIDQFFVRSDVNVSSDTPEPGTVAQLVSMGVMGGGVLFRRRRK